jgi:Ca2+-binding RTX toxin-like protein
VTRLYGHGGANRIAGGEGDDQIATDGPGRLSGGPGLDTIHAGAGDDLVDPGPGRDQVQSLGGTDRLLLRDGEHDDADAREHPIVLHAHATAYRA